MSTNGIFTRKRLIERLEAMAGIAAGILTVGNIYFLSSVSGNASYTGADPAHAVATLAQALALCTANNNDVIIVDADHAETIVGAAGSGITKAGVQVVGTGIGDLRPTFTFTTAAAASFDITAANTRISNCRFVCNIDAQTAMINVTAAAVTIDNCELVIADATYQATLGLLTTAAADRFKFLKNHIHGTTDAGCAAALRIVGGNDIIIAGNYCHGAFTTTLGMIDNVTTAGLRWLVEDNTVVNATASSTVCMTFVSTTTGVLRRNTFSILSGTAPVVGAALNAMSGNYYKAAAGAAAGTLL